MIPGVPIQRRGHARAKMRFPVKILSVDSGYVREGQGSDFSVGGLFVSLSDPPPIGTIVMIEFDLSPVGDIVKVEGKVIRTVTEDDDADEQNWGAGLELTGLAPEQKGKLHDWVQRLRQFEVGETIAMPPAPDDSATLGKEGPAASEPEVEIIEVEEVASEAPTAEGAEESQPSPGGVPSFADMITPVADLLAPPPENAPTPEGAEVEVRVRIQGFDYMTRHHEVKMTAEGLFIRTEAPLPTGSQVDLEFDSKKDGEVFNGKGEVMRIVTTRIPRDPKLNPGMAIRITASDDATRAFLKVLMDKTAEEAF